MHEVACSILTPVRRTQSLHADQKSRNTRYFRSGARCWSAPDEQHAVAASKAFTMRCVVCGCDKVPARFSSAQKKRPAAKRKCAACTAANGSDAQVHAGAPPPSLASQAAKNAPREAAHNATTPDTSPDDRAAAAVDITAPDGVEAGTMACSACGKQLAGTTASHQHWQKCSRCKQTFYCDAGCQREHWTRSGHKRACKEPMSCNICLDNDGCRSEARCAHVACRVQAAEHQGTGFHARWHTCATCKQQYTGAMQLGLAEALWERHRRKPARNQDRLAAQNLLAAAYMAQGRDAEAAELFRGFLAAFQRLVGSDHQNTLIVAMNLGSTLQNQGKGSEAEAVLRDTLPRLQRVHGPEHGHTLSTARALAVSLQDQQKYDEAEPLLRDTLAIQRRMYGDGHLDTVETCRYLATLLTSTRGYREAEELSRGALAQARRTLGPEHPGTLSIARVLGRALSRQQDKAVEAEALLADTLALQQHVRGAITRKGGGRHKNCKSCSAVKHGGTTHSHVSMHGAARPFCPDSPANLAKCSWPAVAWQPNNTRPFFIDVVCGPP